MQAIRLYVEEVLGDWFGWIEGCPGAFSKGATPEEAVYTAPGAVTEYVNWLLRHGETPSDELREMLQNTFRVEVVEKHAALRSDDGREVHAFFKLDAAPLATTEIERYLELLRYTRSDLLEALSVIPPDQRSPAPFGGKPINTILCHIADVELGYLTRLGVAAPDPLPSDPEARLSVARTTLETFARSSPANIDRVHVEGGEHWNLRKTLHRSICHERYHIAQIVARANPSLYLREIVVNAKLHDQAPVPMW